MNSSTAPRPLSGWGFLVRCAALLILLGLWPLALSATEESKEGEQLEADTIAPPPNEQPADLALKPEGVAKAEALTAYLEGVRAETEGDVDKAMAAYQRSLARDPGNVELADRLAEEFARRGDVALGISMLKDAIKAAPKEASPRLALSNLYGKYLRKTDLALKYAYEALELDAADLSTYLAVYQLQLAAKEPKKADQILERATKSPSTDASFWAGLGDAFQRSFLKPDGSGTPEQIAKITALYQKAVTLAPHDPDILGKAADFLIDSKQYAAAVPLYRELMSLDPTDPAMASAPFKLAWAMHGSGQRKEAIDFLQDILQKNPASAEAYDMLGQLYQEEGDLAKALSSYQRSILHDPSQPLIYLRVADMFLRAKQAEKAVDTLEEARARFPDVPRFTFLYAVALSQAKRPADALATFAQAEIDGQAGNVDMLGPEFYFQWGAAAEEAGDTKKAAELMRRSISLDPSQGAEALNFLGYMWVDRGENLDEAGQLIAQALALDPQNGAFLDSRGWWNFKRGDFKKAFDDLLAAVRLLKPEDAVVYDHLGDACQQLGKKSDAINYWEKALKLDPDNQKIAAKLDEAKKKVTALPPTAPAQP